MLVGKLKCTHVICFFSFDTMTDGIYTSHRSVFIYLIMSVHYGNNVEQIQQNYIVIYFKHPFICSAIDIKLYTIYIGWYYLPLKAFVCFFKIGSNISWNLILYYTYYIYYIFIHYIHIYTAWLAAHTDKVCRAYTELAQYASYACYRVKYNDYYYLYSQKRNIINRCTKYIANSCSKIVGIKLKNKFNSFKHT